MRAPNEKHLEDWIVNNLPLFGEPTDPDLWDYIPDEYWMDIYPLCSQLVSRQLRLPTGRCDLIGIREAPNTLAVIELKAGTIDYKVVGQCLKYIHDLREVFFSILMSVREQPYRVMQSIEQFPLGAFTPVSGLLVGHTLIDDMIPVVCSACDIEVVTYEYDSEEDTYTFQCHNQSPRGKLQDYEEYALGAVGDALRHVIKTQGERYPVDKNGGAE